MSMKESKSKDETLSGSGVDLDNIFQSSRRTVLVVDDEPDTITLIKHIFMTHDFNVAGATSGKDALRKVVEVNPSIILLDLLMPEMNGMQTLEEIHKISDVPVIFLSAVGQKEDIIAALKSGTDDYVTKPFNGEELVARVEAVLRRAEKSGSITQYIFPEAGLSIDMKTYEILYKGKSIQLTGKMFEVLVLLAKFAPRVVKYQEIVETIWDEDSVAVRNRLKYLIYLLRKEFLNVDPETDIIQNVDRLGYKLLVRRE